MRSRPVSPGARDGRDRAEWTSEGSKLRVVAADDLAGPARKLVARHDRPGNRVRIVDPRSPVASIVGDSGGNQITAATSGPGAGQPSVTLTSGYDQDHDLTSIADNLSSPGLTTFQYDAAFRLTTITTSYGGTTGPQVVLGYDPGNLETSITRTVGGSGTSVSTTLSYDAADRLTTITDGYYTPVGSGGSGVADWHVCLWLRQRQPGHDRGQCRGDSDVHV